MNLPFDLLLEELARFTLEAARSKLSVQFRNRGEEGFSIARQAFWL
jgi:hypothetical protein